MNIFEATFLGLIQGLTEWLPVSSSGHLVLIETWFDIKEGNIQFDILLHLASLFVIAVYFRRQIAKIIKNGFKKTNDQYSNWLLYIIISSVITAAIGFWFYDTISFLRQPAEVANALFLTSALLLATRFFKGDNNITWWHAVILGFIQGLAVMPGISRSGAVIAIALLLKVKKSLAFEYAFILAIPAIFGSFILSFRDLAFEPVFLVGFIVTIIVSFLTLSWLRKVVSENKFYLFFLYTLALILLIKAT